MALLKELLDMFLCFAEAVAMLLHVVWFFHIACSDGTPALQIPWISCIISPPPQVERIGGQTLGSSELV